MYVGESDAVEGENSAPVLHTAARQLDEPGYVFALAVAPDSKPGSELFALVAARYNVVKICL